MAVPAETLKEKRSIVKSVVERLRNRYNAGVAEVEDLKSGETAVEERARSELGMVKPGETFSRVVEPNPGTEADADKPQRFPEGPPVEFKDAQRGESAAPDAAPTE